MTKLPELLAPAGTRDALRAAVAAGADAVYLGVQSFNARAFAGNFTPEALAEDIPFCHAHGVRVYITLNTLLLERELAPFIETARELALLGADAAIVADLGAMRALSRHVPSLPLHASTQAFAHSLDGVRTLAALGCTRTVVARELSQSDLSYIVQNAAPIEIEVFAHGALCVSHSGQCLFSALVGGRSGNRGECAQPCRLPDHRGRYPLSLSDLSLAAHIPALIDMGVASLKLEGRMKPPHYVYHVTRIFRRLLDERRGACEDEMQELARVFSRSGFTDGYFTKRLAHMNGTRTEKDKEQTRALSSETIPPCAAIPLTASLTVQRDAQVSLSLKSPLKSVTVTAEPPLAATSAALTREALAARMAKMGGTPFTLAPADITVTLDTGLFLPVSVQNDLRRRAVSALLGESTARDSGTPYERSTQKSEHAVRYLLLCESEAQYAVAAAFAAVPERKAIAFLSYEASLTAKDAPMGVMLPPVVMDSERAAVLSHLRALRARGTVYALVAGVGSHAIAKEADLVQIGGIEMGITNAESAVRAERAGLCAYILSAELSLARAREIGAGILPIYGRLPLMLTERCYMREIGGSAACRDCGSVSLTDRRGVSFPILRVHGHRNRIVNSRPLYMLDKKEELDRFGFAGGALFFTVESAEETARILAAMTSGSPYDGVFSRTPK